MARIVNRRKAGLLKWEADVEHGRTVFTFIAFTKTGALRKANLFLNSLPKEDNK